MKKSFAIFITALLVLSTFAFVAPVRASTGHPELGYMDGIDWFVCDTTIDVKAGTMDVYAMDGGAVSPTGNFTIFFNSTNPEPVDFSGAVFDLYMSKDGYSSLSADDVMYAGSFDVNDLETPGLMAVNITNSVLKNGVGTFYIGCVNETQMLVGPIPYDITNEYHYIKVFDGTGTLVAVGAYINILASLNLVPTSGPGGAYVCLTGVALAANQMYNISYDDDVTTAAQVTTGDNGQFEFCWHILDLCEVYNGCESEVITVYLWETGGDFVDSVDFTEMYRVFLSFYSDYMGTYDGPYGNNTSYWDVHIFDDFVVEGNWFNPTGPVVITVEGIELASVTPNATGYFEASFTIPILSIGNHTVKVSNVGCNVFFEIWVYPTLVVVPDEGPIGTEVTFEAYGFPANIPVYLYWEVDQTCDYDYCYLWVANTTTGSGGTFNVTTTWVIPKMPGGWHYITARDTFYWENQTCDFSHETDEAEIAWTRFYVTPTIWATPGSFAADGTTFWINGSGLDPYTYYIINVDNQAFAMPTMMDYYESYTYFDGYWEQDYMSINGYYDYVDLFNNSWDWIGAAGPLRGDLWGEFYSSQRVAPDGHFVIADTCGDLAIQVVKAGFRPGVHTVALYESMTSDAGWYPISTFATFTVTTEGDPVIGDITANITQALAGLNARLTAIEGDIATIQTDVGTLKVSVNALDAKVVALQGSVATVQTTLGTMTGTLTSVAGDMATVKTQVGTINANVASVKSFLPVDMMPVWIAVIFAIIAAIASIYGVLVIRSKIAQ